jgi:hypothetical protein
MIPTDHAILLAFASELGLPMHDTRLPACDPYDSVQEPIHLELVDSDHTTHAYITITGEDLVIKANHASHALSASKQKNWLPIFGSNACNVRRVPLSYPESVESAKQMFSWLIAEISAKVADKIEGDPGLSLHIKWTYQS